MKTIAVLGLGSIGQRHARNLMALGHEVIGYDPVSSPIPVTHLSTTALAAIERADAVVVASPSKHHHEHLYQSICAKKHVLVEKPFVTERHDATRLWLRQATQNNLVVMAGHNLRFHDCVVRAKRWLEMAGHAPQWAHFTVAQFTSKPDYLRESVAANWAVHEIDVALHLLGPAFVRCAYKNDNITTFTLQHVQGCISSFHANYIAQPERRGFVIGSTEGELAVDLVERCVRLHSVKDNITHIYHGTDSWDQNYQDEMKAFLLRIQGSKTLGASGEEGLQAAEIVKQIHAITGP